MEKNDINSVYQMLSKEGMTYAFLLFGHAVHAFVYNKTELTDDARCTWLPEHNCAGRVTFPAVQLMIERSGCKVFDSLYESLKRQMDESRAYDQKLYSRRYACDHPLHVKFVGHNFLMCAFALHGDDRLFVDLNLGARGI